MGFRSFLKILFLGLAALTGCQPPTFPPPGQQRIWLILWCPASSIRIDSIAQPYKNMPKFFGLDCPANQYPRDRTFSLSWQELIIPNEATYITLTYRTTQSVSLPDESTVFSVPFYELPCFLNPITARCGTFDSDEQPLILVVRDKPSSAIIEPPLIDISFCAAETRCDREISPGQSRQVYETVTPLHDLLFYAQAETHSADVVEGKTSFAARNLQENTQLRHSYTLHLAEQQETDEYELPIDIRTISVTPEGRVNTLWVASLALPAQPKLFPDSPGISGRWKGTLQLDNAPPESSQPVPLTLLLRQEGKTLRGNVVLGTSEHLWKESRETEPNHYVFTISKEGFDSSCVHKFDGQALPDNQSLGGTFEVNCYGPWGDRPYYSGSGKWQVTRKPGTNQRPVAHVPVSKVEGRAPMKIQLDGSGSYDSDGKIVDYHWHEENAGWATDPHGMIASYRFDQPGVYTVTLTVTDDDGATSRDQVRIIVR